MEILTFLLVLPLTLGLFWGYLLVLGGVLRRHPAFAAVALVPTVFQLIVLPAVAANSAEQWAIGAAILIGVFGAWLFREYGHQFDRRSG